MANVNSIATTSGIKQITVSWNVDTTEHLAEFWIYCVPAPSTNWGTPTIVPANARSYTITGLNDSTQYSVEVRAIVGGGAKQTLVTTSTPPPPPPPPPPPTNTMIVGLDTGWTNWGDIAGATKHLRVSSGEVAGVERRLRREVIRFTDDIPAPASTTNTNVSGAADAGISLSCILFGTSGSIGGINATTFANQIVTYFEQYGKGGTFWHGRTDLGAQFAEVLNEPGGSWFWSDAGNYQAYSALLKTVYGAVQSSFAPAIRPKVLASYDGGQDGSNSFGKGVLATGGYNYCDNVTCHPYGGGSGQHGGAQGCRSIVTDAYLTTGKHVCITEVGWPTAVGQPATGDSQQWSQGDQAASITSLVNWAKGTGYVDLLIYFNYADYGTNDFYGIVTSKLAHKPAYAALGAFA